MGFLFFGRGRNVASRVPRFTFLLCLSRRRREKAGGGRRRRGARRGMPCIICGIWLGLSYGKSKCYLYAVRVRPPSQKLMTTNARMSTTCTAYRRAWHSLCVTPSPSPALAPCTVCSICGSISRCVFVCDKIFTCLQIERLELCSVCFACHVLAAPSFCPQFPIHSTPLP